MGTVIVCNIVSLDGYVTGPDDNVMVMPMDPAFDRMNVEHMRTAGTLLLGRRSYEMFRSYWPAIADRPDESDDNREISRLYRDLDIVVVSDTVTVAPDEPWAANTTVIRRADAAAHVRSIDGEVLVFGSHTMWLSMLRAGAVDELHLMIGNVVLGGGRRVFDGPLPVGLSLIGAGTSEGSDNVVVRYAVTRRDG